MFKHTISGPDKRGQTGQEPYCCCELSLHFVLGSIYPIDFLCERAAAIGIYNKGKRQMQLKIVTIAFLCNLISVGIRPLGISYRVAGEADDLQPVVSTPHDIVWEQSFEHFILSAYRRALMI